MGSRSVVVRSILLTAMVTTGLLAGVQHTQTQTPKRLALVGGMLIDGNGMPPVHHAAVLIEGNRIVQVGRAEDVTIPPGTTVVDTSGRTMMPGLIELHAHLVIVGHGNYQRWFKWLEDHKDAYPLQRIMEISAAQLLMAGVTSAVDLGSPLKESVAVRDRINRRQVPGPRMSMSGPWIIQRNAIFPPMCQVIVHTAEEAAQATEANIAGGADVIKCQGGLTFDEYKAVADTAHKHNVKVHAHLNDEKAIREAFAAGIDVIQHAGAGSTPPYTPELIKMIVDARRAVVPTTERVAPYPATVAFPERIQDPQIKAGFPPDLWAEVQDSLKDPLTLSYFNNEDRRETFTDAALKQWINSDALIGMGTDNGTPLNFHADALWRDAKMFVDRGMTPLRTIGALTKNGAMILGKQDQLGTIEKGKLADIIVVQGDPLFDIAASLSNVEVVVKDGEIYKGSSSKKP